MLLPSAFRRIVSDMLALVGAFALVGAGIALIAAREGSGGWRAFPLLTGLVVASWWGTFRVRRGPRSRAAVTGHIVLFEAPLVGPAPGRTPPLTIRGPRDAVERFIPLEEFGALFGGLAIWRAPRHPIPEMPGQALGVWSRRTCQRFRRILRERGATIEVRREPGPAQRLARWEAHPGRRIDGSSSGSQKT